MNDLSLFVTRNSKKLAKVDYRSLISISAQLEALQQEKDQKRKAGAKQAIEIELQALYSLTESQHYSIDSKSRYANQNNRDILTQAIIIARRLLRSL